MTLDHTITRDLAALAADNRRAWRTVDDAFAALAAPRRAIVPPHPEILTLAGLGELFARRVAWIASSAIGILLISIMMISAFVAPAGGDLEKALLMEYGIVPAIGWIAVPMLVLHALTRRLAVRWFVAGLQLDAAPDELARRMVRRVDGWSTGLRITAIAWSITLFGVLYLAFLRRWSALQWLEVFPDGTTAQTRLLPLPIALAAMAAVALVIARAATRGARWLPRLAHTAGVAIGAAAVAVAIGLGLLLHVWPVVVAASTTQLARVALTIAGAGGVLSVVIAGVLRIRARDQRELAAWPPATTRDAVAILPLHQAVVRRTAWIASGIAAVGVVGALLATLEDHVRDVGVLHWLAHFEVVQQLGFELVSRVVGALAVLALAHGIGVRVGQRMFDRVVARAVDPIQAARQLADQLVSATLVAVTAGTSVLALAQAMTVRVLQHHADWVWIGAPPLVATTLRQVAAAALLIVVLALALGRAHRRSSRWLCVLRHPITLVAGVMLGAWTIAAGSHVDLSPYLVGHLDYVHHVWVSHAPELPLLRPALTFGVALSSFLIVTWLGLWRCRRTRAG